MYLEVIYFGDEKTLFYLEKVILWLYNFTRGFYSQKTEILCEDNNWLVPPHPPPPVWFKCLCLRLENGSKIQTRGFAGFSLLGEKNLFSRLVLY